MELLETAKKRFSVRSYTDQKVEPEKLNKILEAAHVAPTAANLQPIHLIVAQSDEALAKISMAANIYNAPLAIIVCADHNKAWVRPFDRKQTGDIDASILTDHMMLAGCIRPVLTHTLYAVLLWKPILPLCPRPY